VTGRAAGAAAALAGAALAVAATVGATAGSEQTTAAVPRRAFELTVEALDAAGRAPVALDPGSLDVAVGDAPAAVVDARPATAGEWEVVVYVDALASSSTELERAAAALEAASARLASLGPVTLLVADTLVEPWQERASDVDELRGSFAELGAATFEATEKRPPEFAAARRALLLDQLGRRPWGRGARVLLLVGDVNGERARQGSTPDAASADAPARRGELAAAVAALGWVVLPFHLAGGGVALSPLADATGGDAVGDGAELDAALERLGGRQLLRIEAPARPASGDAAAGELGGGAIAPLRVTGPSGVGLRAARWIATSTPEFALVARVNALADGEGGELEVSASAQLDSDASGRPELAAEVLAEAADGAPGAAAVFAGSSSRLRASFVVASLDEAPRFVHRQGSGALLDGRQGWLLQARLDAPADLEGMAVVVEDVTTGAWGAAFAEVDGEDIETPPAAKLAIEVADLRRPATPPAAAAAAQPSSLVRLVPPRARELTGVQTFRAMALNAFIERVAFLLDGVEVASSGRDPWNAAIDLGPKLAQHEVKAVAYDRAGRKLGEDSITINRPRAAFGVDIVALRGGAAGGEGTVGGPRPAPSQGPVEVEAQVTVPARRRIERVEFFWNETLQATLTAPPWTAKLDVAPGAGGDYVRAVAHLDDGQSMEDVELVGVAGEVEKVEVNLVEIFAVVLDRDGAPVHDLARGEVAVRLAGDPVELERFGVAEDLPLDVGLVIDTSQSMEFLMDDTRQAALRFLADLVRPGDRAFLVDFDTKPRLAHAMTRQLADLMRSMRELRADGNTALYDAILFSVLQFEEGEDRRAVVLLTDGDDYKSRFSAHQAALQARSAGVPVYLISLAAMDWLRPALKNTDLESIAKQTGGRVFYVTAREELGPTYARIGDELRSQYVMAFSTPRPLTDAELGKLDVRVSRPGATVRAVVAGRSVQTR
jgi:VWFA-related protein